MPVGQHAQNLEDFRRAVNLVERHESAAVSQSGHGIGQQRLGFRLLEIEVIGRIVRQEDAGERGLAHLAGPHQHHDAGAMQGDRNGLGELSAIDHGRQYNRFALKKESRAFDFQYQPQAPRPGTGLARQPTSRVRRSWATIFRCQTLAEAAG